MIIKMIMIINYDDNDDGDGNDMIMLIMTTMMTIRMIMTIMMTTTTTMMTMTTMTMMMMTTTTMITMTTFLPCQSECLWLTLEPWVRGRQWNWARSPDQRARSPSECSTAGDRPLDPTWKTIIRNTVKLCTVTTNMHHCIRCNP
jgi:hypothetical protein